MLYQENIPLALVEAKAYNRSAEDGYSQAINYAKLLDVAMLSETVCFGNKLCDFHAYEIDKKFLYYYLQSPCFTSIFKNKLTGIIGGVGINKVRNLLLPVPPLEEQKRIVEQLDKYIPVCVK